MENTNENLSQTLPNEPLESHKSYYIGIDILKIIAMFLVFTLHMTQFYDFIITSNIRFVNFLVLMLKMFSYICIALFIMITGYLSYNKEPNAKYYKKLIIIIVEYLLCSVVVWLYRSLSLGQTITFAGGVKAILDFTMAPYAWYINMFIGLYLLAPFLNIFYKALKSQKQKLMLIFILIVIFCFSILIVNGSFDYWTDAFPLLFYFLGLYIKEYKPTIKKKWLLLTILLVVIIQSVLRINVNYFNIETEGTYSIFVLVCSVSVFLLFYNKKSNFSSSKKPALRYVSELSLSTFLVSFIFDDLTSRLFFKYNLRTFESRLPHLLYITPLKFLFSLLLALLIHQLCMAFVYLISHMDRKIGDKKAEMAQS